MLIENKIVGEIIEFTDFAEEQIKGLKYNE
jgi:hypothetical protein